MFGDLRLLVWLHWRQLQRTATYWLRVVGFDPLEETTSNRLYGLYLILIFGGWIILMWSLAVHEALFVGQKIPANTRPDVLDGFLHYFPWFATAVGLVLLLLAIRKSPLKLSVEDLSYVAASPMRRDVIGLVGFSGYTALGLAVVVPLMTLASMLLAHPNSQDELGITAYPAILTSIPVVLLFAAIAWTLGFWRLSRVRSPRFLWLAPVLLAGLTIAYPPIMTWPAHVLARAVIAEPITIAAVEVLAIAFVFVAGVIWLGRSINLITVSEELGATSQLKSLGVLGRYVWRDLSRQLRDRESLARHTPRFALPNVTGFTMLAGRAALIFLRQPLMFAWAVVRAGVIIAGGAYLAAISAPALAWLFWLTFVMARPSREVLGVYSADQSNAFLRQFLACDNLKLLVIDAALPFGTICVVGIAAFAFLSTFAGISILTIPLMVTFTAVMMLSQGAALVRAPGGDPTVASLLYTGLSFGITLLLAEFMGPIAAVITSVVAIWILGVVISTSGRFSAAAFGND